MAFVGEYLLGSCGSLLFAAEEFAEEAFLLGGGSGSPVLGVYGVADSGVGYAAQLVDETDGLLDIVDVVEGIEDTHHVETVGDSFFIETFEHVVGVGHIAEEVSATRESRKQRFSLHGLRDDAQTIPGRFAEIAHYGVGNCAAPYFHDVETGVLVVGKQLVDFSLAQTCCEERLLSVAKCQVADFQFALCHIVFNYLICWLFTINVS